MLTGVGLLIRTALIEGSTIFTLLSSYEMVEPWLRGASSNTSWSRTLIFEVKENNVWLYGNWFVEHINQSDDADILFPKKVGNK